MLKGQINDHNDSLLIGKSQTFRDLGFNVSQCGDGRVHTVILLLGFQTKYKISVMAIPVQILDLIGNCL